MLFNSLPFIVFFPLVVALYFAFPYRIRWLLLLVASYVFYMWWNPRYAVLIFTSTVIDYFAALQMGKQPDRRGRRKYLYISLLGNLGLLGFFKYFNFLNESIRAVMDSTGVPYPVPALDILLPVGISFYTFQTLGYAVDVYRGDQKPERHFGIFALYVSFFPQLVAGPIERSKRLMPQLHTRHPWSYERTLAGLRLMLWGFFKKVLIADGLAEVVDFIYGDPTAQTGIQLAVGNYVFAVQIYCDFSGYSDIACGAAKVMGYDLMENFRRPYFSESMAEFWRRWHISLMTWFRDYVYFPLGGGRVGRWRTYRNIMIVFLISGIWHGASWKFVVWGAFNAVILIVTPWAIVLASWGLHAMNLPVLPWKNRKGRILAVFITFHLWWYSIISFRADSLSDAVYIMMHIHQWHDPLEQLGVLLDRFGPRWSVIMVAFVALLFSVEFLERHRDSREVIGFWPVWLRVPACAALLIAVLVFGEFGLRQFVYFQF